MNTSSSTSIEYASVVSKSDHATSATYHVRPTIFDVLAHENMHSLVRPAFVRLLKWLDTAVWSRRAVTANSHRWWRRLLTRFGDEIYLGVHALIEIAYLGRYEALFAEHFYGLRRQGLTSGTKRALSVLASVVVPYLKAKLDDLYEELEKSFDPTNISQESGVNRSKFAHNLKRVIRLLKLTMLKYYQYFHMLWSLTFWYYRFRFMIQASDDTSPLLSVLNLKLVYNTTPTQSSDNENGLVDKLFSLVNYGFTNALFFVQFLKWFYDYRENRSVYGDDADGAAALTSPSDSSQLVTEPPQLNERLAQNKAYKALTQRPGMCPLCNKKRSNPCALTVSGFAFCYPCIFRYVKENKRCPLTNFPCSTKNIIRIYATTN